MQEPLTGRLRYFVFCLGVLYFVDTTRCDTGDKKDRRQNLVKVMPFHQNFLDLDISSRLKVLRWILDCTNARESQINIFFKKSS